MRRHYFPIVHSFYAVCAKNLQLSKECRFTMSRGSSISIVTRLRAGRPGSFPGRTNNRILSLRHSVQTGSRAHLSHLIQWVLGGCYTVGKAAGELT
jgi:hypothetical protein